MKLHITLVTLDKPLVTLETNKQVPFNSLHAGFFFSWILLLADFFFQNQLFFEKMFQEYHQGFNQFGSRAGPTFVGPAQDPNCLQSL